MSGNMKSVLLESTLKTDQNPFSGKIKERPERNAHFSHIVQLVSSFNLTRTQAS